MKKKKVRIRKFPIILMILIIIVAVYLVVKDKNVFVGSKEIEVLGVELESSQIVVSLNSDAKCALEDLTSDSDKWVQSINNKCTFEFNDDVESIYTMDSKGKVVRHGIDKEFKIIDEVSVSNQKIYLAIGGKEKIEYEIDTKGKLKESPVFTSSDETVATVDKEGNVTGVASGKTTIKMKIKDEEQEVSVVVTSLIMVMPADYNYNKTLLPCGIYSKEDNDLLDEILKNRVYKAGYKTRAGTVAAARFLGLEFPYRIAYFSENGRMSGTSGPVVDGEGRYYHEGLYLHKSRYDIITDPMYGPAIWGCPMYSVPTLKAINNGLDCSGFITWILRQAGYESGDLGAGVSDGIMDMTDLGPKEKLDKALSEGKVKVGDLLSGNGETTNAWDGGHIAFLAGIHNGYYYVAEEMWVGTGYFGAIIRKYTEADFKYYFYWHIDMDEYYGAEGTIDDYWL